MKESIDNIILFMKKNINSEMSIEDIASHFGYSRYYFSRKFKEITGFSASDYLSSLKIDKSKQLLLMDKKSVTDVTFDVGFSSIGTFSTTFTNKTGLSPSETVNQVDFLATFISNYNEEVTTLSKEIKNNSKLTLNIVYPTGYKSNLTFVGLFNSSIPNHKPIVGTALLKKTKHTFSNIPQGKYYLLACSVKKSINPLKYFFLDDCLRGMVTKPLMFPEESNQTMDILLRPRIECDPPILVNLPKLLFDTYKRN